MWCFWSVKSVEHGPSVVLRAARPTAFYEFLMQRKVKMVFSEHVMRALLCVPLRVGKTLVVTMGSQAAYAARALRQPRPPLRGHI